MGITSAKYIGICIATTFFTTILVWLSIFLIFSHPIEFDLSNINGVLFNKSEQPLSKQDAYMLGHLMNEEKILNSSELLDNINSFYTTIITILIVIISLVTFLSVIIVKHNAEDKAEQISEKVTSQKFDIYVKTEMPERLQDVISDELGSTREDLDRLVQQIMEADVGELKKSIEFIMDRLAQLDKEEDQDSSSTVEIEGGDQNGH